MLARLKADNKGFGLSFAEESIDLLFEIGKELYENGALYDAYWWLEESYSILSDHPCESLSEGMEDLRMCLMSYMIRCLMKIKTEGWRDRAWNITQELAGHGDRLAPMLFKLDLLSMDETPLISDYQSILTQICRLTHLTDFDLRTISHYVHRLRKWDAGAAHSVLIDLLERSISDNLMTSIESALVSIVWNCTTSAGFASNSEALMEVLNKIPADLPVPLSQTVVHASQSLIWKRVDAAYGAQQYETADFWCQLCLHETFGALGIANRAKVERKRILCAIGLSDIGKAKDIFSTLSSTTRDDPSTQYLLYKIAIRSEDSQLAASALSAVSAKSANDPSLLYGCVLESQRAGNCAQTLTSLQCVLSRQECHAENSVSLPALLRCTARMLIRDAMGDGFENTSSIDGICNVFEEGARRARDSRRNEEETTFSQRELDWFSRNSYNLALQVCPRWAPFQTLRLVTSCTAFVDLYPTYLENDVSSDLSLRRAFCVFLRCSLLLVIARSEAQVSNQSRHYLELRKSVDEWRFSSSWHKNQLQGPAQSDIRSKDRSLLAYDFEAAACLKAWDSLDSIIEEVTQSKGFEVFPIIADITISSAAPPNVSIRALQRIINASCEQQICCPVQVMRWIRCLISLAFDSPVILASALADDVVTLMETLSKVLPRSFRSGDSL